MAEPTQENKTSIVHFNSVSSTLLPDIASLHYNIADEVIFKVEIAFNDTVARG
jgi:hypothetical protein